MRGGWAPAARGTRCVDAHIVRSQGYLKGAPVRTATTTSWMAWVTAAACLGLSTRESWVEPGTTRCTLSVDRAADWFWSLIHPLLLPTAAVRTTSGFPSRPWSWPASASDRFATPNSSMNPPISFPVAAVVRASSRYLAGRYPKSLSAMTRPTPSREVVATSAERCFRTLYEPARGCDTAVWCEAVESTSTRPATSSGYLAAYVLTYRPPKECPASTYGPGTWARFSSA